MNSSAFKPQHVLIPAVIQELFEKKERAKVNLFTSGTPDELKPNYLKNKNKK